MVAHSTAYAPPDSPAAHHAESDPAALSRHVARLELLRARHAVISRCHRISHLATARRHSPALSTPRPVFGVSRLVKGEPLLCPAEKARLRLEVEIRRDLELWDVGRASPCGWLLVISGPHSA